MPRSTEVARDALRARRSSSRSRRSSLRSLALATPASAIERNFAGSAQLDYHFVPTARAAKACPSTFDGFTMEFAGKLAVDFSDNISANVKVCYGCHGFEADMMYFDCPRRRRAQLPRRPLQPELRRVQPAARSGEPSPERQAAARTTWVGCSACAQWNMGVLAEPVPRQRARGQRHALVRPSVQLDYAAYAVSGFKSDPKALDIDFKLSRSPAGLLRRRQRASDVRRAHGADVQARRGQRPHARRERHVRDVRPEQRSVLRDHRRRRDRCVSTRRTSAPSTSARRTEFSTSDRTRRSSTSSPTSAATSR